MRKLATIATFSALALSGLALSLPTQAGARTHGRIVAVHGPYGGGYHAGRVVSRSPGSVEVHRGAVTHNGRAVRQTRNTSWSEGTVHNDVRRSYRGGEEMQRHSTATRNADGSVSIEKNRSGYRGNEQSSWSTIYRTDDGYTRSRSAATSSGRGFSATRDVSVSDDYVTVQRSASNNRGDAVNSTRTYRRPN